MSNDPAGNTLKELLAEMAEMRTRIQQLEAAQTNTEAIQAEKPVSSSPSRR